jgi:hypothetical protein
MKMSGEGWERVRREHSSEDKAKAAAVRSLGDAIGIDPDNKQIEKVRDAVELMLVFLKEDWKHANN